MIDDKITVKATIFAIFTEFADRNLYAGGGSDDAEYSLEAYSTGLTTMESASFSILASIVNPDMSRYV